ncbi:hypothetical protein HOK68_01430 [Candidatus Woesearchaeota archaeon]|jgi:predicted transcriptional regulator|nr:hypothetical protein [Candidatus Woesearchaeota archaeon]MBT4387067.1 hypothetical protein [Candidatus Woesearchaeota archaeon]MBT4596176.1 hypothetical protein [Candidatus Woesearchaeota archaeon]MBT5741601.1 hypothetical protein [Candidatus Woesearchaeota archaeon]MBT6505422.1 hypothetical protein [Candidatus Woesearchaeota archaeon]
MSKKREKLQVIFDILKSIMDKGGKIKPTHLMYKSNLSHTMMKEYLNELMSKGFISEEFQKRGKNYILTDKGYKYLTEYKVVLSFLENFGLGQN